MSLAAVEDCKFVGKPGEQSISGLVGFGFLRRSRRQIDETFVEHYWIINPEWDLNLNSYRSVRGGLLHNELADVGMIITDGNPYQRDVAMVNDIDKDPYPAGISLHSDRRINQIRERDTFVDLRVLPGINQPLLLQPGNLFS